jgi:signal transduction histidine kinase
VLGATREAALNAAVHSGAANVDVFAEVRPSGVDVFVRDTGTGFDPTMTPDDHGGVADSIVARIERVGGTVTIESQAGVGTEVELHLDRGER